MKVVGIVLAIGWLGSSEAHAQVDPKCQEVADAGPPADYDEGAQNEFLLNYPALYTTLSPAMQVNSVWRVRLTPTTP